MRFTKKSLLSFVILLTLAFSLVPGSRAAYTAPVSTLRVGLYYNNNGTTQKSFPSANLQNASGHGWGYEFGYFDENRKFVSVGAVVDDTNKITMMMDKNMVYDASTRSYKEGTEGSAVVGCFHIELSESFENYETAKAVADALETDENVFIKYSSGLYYVCVGSYISSELASSAIEEQALGVSCGVTEGTAYTVTVTETGTNRILFEFDYGTKHYLAVMPRSENGEKTVTYYKNLTYYGAFAYVREYRGNLTVVNYVDIEDYVKGLLPSEMSASWPVEALKAQAVCARTYAMSYLNKHGSQGFDLCNTTDCQVYEGTSKATANSDRAADETAGMYLTYNGKLCETYYYASNGGASENSENVWTYARPYLVGVIDPYEADIAGSVSGYNWETVYTGDQIAARLRNRGYSCSTIVKFDILEFTPTGNVLRIRFTDSTGKTFTFSKENCRLVLGLRSQRYTIEGVSPNSNTYFVNSASEVISGLLSELFGIGKGGVDSLVSGDVYAISGKGSVDKITGTDSATSTGSTFVISGSGHGHNVGMSQWGAYSMAKYHDMTYEDILTFYYQNSEITYSVSENS